MLDDTPRAPLTVAAFERLAASDDWEERDLAVALASEQGTPELDAALLRPSSTRSPPRRWDRSATTARCRR